MAGLHLGGAEDAAQQVRQAQQARQAALEGERRRQERAAKLAEMAFDSPEEAEEEEAEEEQSRITKLKEKAATSKAKAKAKEEDRETFASEESRVKMAQLAAAVLANERTAERYARVSDAQTVALNEFIDIVDPIMDLPMFNPGVNHNETVAEAEAAVTAARKQRQAFREQALKIMNNMQRRCATYLLWLSSGSL